MATSGNRTLETQTPEPPYQFAPGYRFHPSGSLYREANSAQPRNRIVVANLQNQPFLKDFLKNLLTPVQRSLIRPDTGNTRNLAEVGAVFKRFITSPFHSLMNITADHTTHNSAELRISIGASPPITGSSRPCST